MTHFKNVSFLLNCYPNQLPVSIDGLNFPIHQIPPTDIWTNAVFELCIVKPFRMITSDTKVFEQLFQTYYLRLVKFCRYFLEDLQEAEDLVVDVFTKIWFKHNTGFCSFDDPKGYLFKAVYNECMLHLKKRTRTNRNSRQYFDYTQKPIHENHLDHENQTNILAQVEKLPPRHKLIIELYYFKSLPLAKIAEELNIPLNTVKSHKSRAESRIAKQFLNVK